ncbi:MAG: glycosyltransferase, partial [Actinomycetota bacterium]|nr:glycosyltransferase [Actinomycetota bacterium]
MAESPTDVTDAAEPHTAPGRGRTWTDNRWLLYVAFVAVAFALSIPALNNRVYNSDEAYLATQAKMLNDGARLYEDTVDRKPPVVPYLYAGVFRLTGSDDIRPVRVLMILTNALTALLLAVEAERRFGRRRAGVIA